MNYKEARVYLDSVAKYGSVLGLDNMREMLGRLGNPQDELRFIHIAGTNGKGSVLAYLSTVLKSAGYRVGRYISPTLFSYRERIQVNEEFIKKESLAAHVTRVREIIEDMTREGKPHPTLFEIETAVSFLYFLEQRCDIVTLETGMGGAEDATNIIKTTILEVLVSIGMDHMQFLGNSLKEIAAQKAGIIKPHTEVVTAWQKPEAMEVIEARAKELGCRLRKADFHLAEHIHYGIKEQFFSYGGYENLMISLAGTYQIRNAVTAVEAVKALRDIGYEITEDHLRQGLKDTCWRGRFTVISESPLFIIDGAHNPDGALMLKDSIQEYLKGKRIFFICGVLKDKEYERILEIASPYSEDMITVETPGNPRALPAKELARTAKKYYRHVHGAENIREAVVETLEHADKENDVVLAFGSLSFLGELTRTVAELKERR